MTSAEMLTLYRERYNLSSNTNDDKLDDELYLLLNIAVNRFIKQRFTGNNVRSIPFEGDQKRMDDLRTLIKKSGEIAVDVASIDEIPNGKQYLIPSDFLFLIKGYYKIGNNWCSFEAISNDDSYTFIQSVHNTPFIREAKMIYENETSYTILVNPDEFSILGVTKLQYLKIPDVIAAGTPCNLPDHTHEEIVEIAISLAIEQVEATERFQLHNENIKSIE